MDEPVKLIQGHQESSMLGIALDDFTISIVDVDTHRVVRRFVGHTAQITDVTFSPDSRWLISASMDCSIRTWDISSGQLIDQFATDLACLSLSMSPTGEFLATAHVDSFGIFLWLNKTLYAKVTLKALTPLENPPLVFIQEFSQMTVSDEAEEEVDEEKYSSPAQINDNLVTLSGLSTSHWQNLLEMEIIRNRNKPKNPPKVSKTAPFFLPTLSSLNDITFDVKPVSEESSRILKSVSLLTLTDFGKMLQAAKCQQDFTQLIDKFKSFGPSMLDFEVKSLSVDSGGNVKVMLQYFKFIEFMLKSNTNFELAEAYMGLFLKTHGFTIAQERTLSNYLPSVSSCHNVAWNRMQDTFLYIQCVLKNLKTM